MMFRECSQTPVAQQGRMMPSAEANGAWTEDPEQSVRRPPCIPYTYRIKGC